MSLNLLSLDDLFHYLSFNKLEEKLKYYKSIIIYCKGYGIQKGRNGRAETDD